MPYAIDETHDPNLESWVESANAAGGDFGVPQQGQGDEPVVIRGLRIVEDGGHLLEVGGPQFEGDSLDGLVGEIGEGVGMNLDNGFALELRHLDEIGGEADVFGGIFPQGKLFLEIELGHGKESKRWKEYRGQDSNLQARGT